MRKRNIQVLLRINEEEKAILDKKCKKANCNSSAFLRNCIKNKEIKEAKSKDYYTLYKEINAIGNNMNQITKAINTGFGQPSDIDYLKRKMEDIYLILERD